ncbi:MAG: bestrophin family ion channel [Archangium sp.]|nr:bestrophin family ion channel [Archangium sp.]MDP3156882.1 bestrophin family ion channel [Archangium sp.]MDP3575559.1 bestrophin family ion channel [Archangium sp.]
MLVSNRVPLSYVFDRVKVDVLRVVFFSLLFQVIKYFINGWLPEVPMQFPALLGTSIALLLAFNINQSYERWWEARKIWGAIVNDSRTLILQLACFVSHADPSLRRFAHRQIGWCYALGASLRGHAPLDEAQKELLSADDLAFASSQTNVPLGLLMRHQLELAALHQAGQLNDFQQIQLDSTLVRLCESMGRAERIKNTVFPVTYRLFLHLFIYLFLLVLSLALVGALGLYEVPVLVLVASTFFLVERTALYMQDPFEGRPTDTAMTAIARAIEINLRQLTGETEVPPPLEPQGFFLM